MQELTCLAIHMQSSQSKRRKVAESPTFLPLVFSSTDNIWCWDPHPRSVWTSNSPRCSNLKSSRRRGSLLGVRFFVQPTVQQLQFLSELSRHFRPLYYRYVQSLLTVPLRWLCHPLPFCQAGSEASVCYQAVGPMLGPYWTADLQSRWECSFHLLVQKYVTKPPPPSHPQLAEQKDFLALNASV